MSDPIVVIGGGIVGTSIALHALDRGACTFLVDRDTVPQGASTSSFASISALDESSHDLYFLKAASLPAWHLWSKRLKADIGLQREGEIRWAQTSEGAADITNKVKTARGRGYPVRLITAKQLEERLPSAKPGRVIAASFAPEDLQVDPTEVISVARRVFQDSGGVLLNGKGRVVVSEKGVEIRVGEDTVHASVVVLATGAETAGLGNQIGWDIPLAPSPSLLITTTPAAPMAGCAVYIIPTSGPPIHLRQLADGRVLVGERGQDFVTNKPTSDHAATLLRQARRFFPPLRRAALDHFSTEWRPMPTDHMPVIGPVPGLPELYVAVMHSGVTLAPAVGDLVAQEIVERRSFSRLLPFRPARFGERLARLQWDLEEVFNHPVIDRMDEADEGFGEESEGWDV